MYVMHAIKHNSSYRLWFRDCGKNVNIITYKARTIQSCCQSLGTGDNSFSYLRNAFKSLSIQIKSTYAYLMDP